MVHRFVTALGLLLALAGPAAAQVAPDTLPADSTRRENTAPRNAFIKALLVPGWGHFSIGTPVRGVFYVALEGSSWYMLGKTLRKLADAQDRERGFVKIAKDSLNALMAADSVARKRLSDPLAYDAAIAAHPDVARLSPLVKARKQQRQDWITYTVFFTFLSAVDAYVTAQLQGFPGDITATPTGDGGVALRFDVPLPGPGRR
ncbi:MAG: hypothetical protein FIB01_13970 [Gemmatimonadetes bacterium]|nr:hypothetical protein [Gemmatimonadota bacterium]